jgi:predicted unusual protein kinase regulating ubiquinone biosynthesis (AarF/ABC1/UbiB family)
MSERKKPSPEKAVPKSRIGRFSRVARMVGGVAGGMLAEGARQLGEGKRPKVGDMILTPGNAKRVAKQLSAMRGAAMKIGQLLSMETDALL